MQDARNDGNATNHSGADSSDAAAGINPTPCSDPEGSTAAADDRPRRGLPHVGRGRRVAFSAAAAAEVGRVDDSYFDSYSYLDIHRDMLADKVGSHSSVCIAICMCAQRGRGFILPHVSL